MTLFARTLPLALVVAFAATASVAQDRPNTTLVQKSKSSAAAPAAKKSSAQAPAAVSGDATVKAGSKQRTPEMSTPASNEPSYEGCNHGKGAEA